MGDLSERPGRASLSIGIFAGGLFLLAGYAAGQAAREARAVKIDEPVKIDGVLDEAAWSRAPILSDFIQFAGAFGSADARYDLDGDGTVGFSDFLQFAAAFGQPVGKRAWKSKL